jgi:hypothetical protein
MPMYTHHLLSDIFTIQDFICGSGRVISVNKNIFLYKQIVIYQGIAKNVKEFYSYILF